MRVSEVLAVYGSRSDQMVNRRSVAAVAAVVSYEHSTPRVHAHGETG
jgi:hypothetical protein